MTGRGRRLAAATAAAVVLVVALVPPVRATVLELFRIGGVSVREAPAPPDTSGASGTTVGTPPTSGGVSRDSGTIVLGSLVEAERRTGLSITTPPALGPPDSVALTRDGRVVELTWGGETDGVRLDVFDGGLAWGYLKTIWQEVTPTEVAGREGVWFPSPHLLQWVDRSGRTEATEPRVAGPTLVWVGQGSDGREITYRLEGPRTLPEALALVSGGGTTVPQR